MQLMLFCGQFAFIYKLISEFLTTYIYGSFKSSFESQLNKIVVKCSFYIHLRHNLIFIKTFLFSSSLFNWYLDNTYKVLGTITTHNKY